MKKVLHNPWAGETVSAVIFFHLVLVAFVPALLTIIGAITVGADLDLFWIWMWMCILAPTTLLFLTDGIRDSAPDVELPVKLKQRFSVEVTAAMESGNQDVLLDLGRMLLADKQDSGGNDFSPEVEKSAQELVRALYASAMDSLQDVDGSTPQSRMRQLEQLSEKIQSRESARKQLRGNEPPLLD